MTAAIPKWIPLKQAVQITGHPSTEALSDWCRRWNEAHSDAPVQRRHGFIEQHSLLAALRLDSKLFNQAERVNDALASLHRRDHGGKPARVVSMRRSA